MDKTDCISNNDKCTKWITVLYAKALKSHAYILPWNVAPLTIVSEDLNYIRSVGALSVSHCVTDTTSSPQKLRLRKKQTKKVVTFMFICTTALSQYIHCLKPINCHYTKVDSIYEIAKESQLSSIRGAVFLPLYTSCICHRVSELGWARREDIRA